jgi:hypothetical protein
MSAIGRRHRRYVETEDYLQMVRRILSAAARRVAEGDEQQFRALADLQTVLDTMMAQAVRGLRESGYTWQQIGDAAGTTRQAAHERFARRIEQL